MANEAEKAFRRLHDLVAAAKEILALEDALKVIGNSDAEIAKMAAERQNHQNAIANLKVEEEKAGLGVEKAKGDALAKIEIVEAEVAAKGKQLESRLGPLQSTLSNVEDKIAAARVEHNQLVAEIRQAKTEAEEQQRYLNRLRESIAALQKQHGINA